MSAPGWFEEIGIPRDCVFQRSSARERGRSFSITPQRGDEIWCVRVDGCWLQDDTGKRVDYLFWGQSAAGSRLILLVELKGQDFGTALEQIESTLGRFCKEADGDTVHTGDHRASPGHDAHRSGGVRAFVVLSKGRGVPQYTRKREALRRKYGVVVYHHERKFEAHGLDSLPGR